MTAASEVFADLAAEQDALAAMLGRLGDADWAKPSAAGGWSVSDVVLHLAQTEELVPATVNGTMSGLRRSGQAGEPARWTRPPIRRLRPNGASRRRPCSPAGSPRAARL